MICDCDLTLVTDKFQFVIGFYLILIPLTHRFFICSIDRGVGKDGLKPSQMTGKFLASVGAFLTKNVFLGGIKNAKLKLQNIENKNRVFTL